MKMTLNTLMSVFNTEFLHKLLVMIVNEVSEPHIVFVGSVDSWPENLFKSKYATMIFNTDYENEVGEHWVAVYIDGKMKSAYIFDSLPVRPFPQNIIKKLSKICNKIYDINPQRYILQRPDFPLCGIYCLVFLERYSKNQPFLLCPENRLLNDVNVLKHMLPYIVSAVDFFA